jgi:50S ribosomal protein L16 3-hydroxylase
MAGFAEKVLNGIRWSGADVRRFLGEYLTQPKPQVVFRPTRAKGAWIRLDPKTQLLYSGGRFFINGDAFSPPTRCHRAMRALADRRELRADRLASEAKLIGKWWRAGYLHLEKRDG